MGPTSFIVLIAVTCSIHKNINICQVVWAAWVQTKLILTCWKQLFTTRKLRMSKFRFKLVLLSWRKNKREQLKESMTCNADRNSFKNSMQLRKLRWTWLKTCITIRRLLKTLTVLLSIIDDTCQDKIFRKVIWVFIKAITTRSMISRLSKRELMNWLTTINSHI